jgi:hypothetical protein
MSSRLESWSAPQQTDAKTLRRFAARFDRLREYVNEMLVCFAVFFVLVPIASL